MKNFLTILGVIALTIIINLGFINFNSSRSVSVVKAEAKSVYSRVIESGKIRCGYIPYEPGLIKDPNTGKFSGIMYETMEEIANNLKLKVEWTEEVGWGTMIEGLDRDRYDAICSPVWANTTRGKIADFSEPLFYSGIGAYIAQANDKIVDLNNLNSPTIKIATIDGEMSDIIASSQFPQAQKISLPQNSDVSQVMLDVQNAKADITFVEPFIAEQYLKNNPNSVRNVIPSNPIRTFGNCFMFKKGQPEFKRMLDVAIAEVLNKGFVEKSIAKYEIVPNTFYRVQKPYKS
jgi:polar amino acid transport system substrate-binding protein